ncbi:MAG: multiheme c-type cytochrome [Acidobacteriota bacterium]
MARARERSRGRALFLSGGLFLAAAASPGTADPPQSRRVVVTGEMSGYLEPCGCAKPMIGGLPRRATMLAQRPPWILVDNGDTAGGVGRQQEMKLGVAARSLVAMGYDAVNVGEKDLRLGPAFTVVRDQVPVPFVSANIFLAGEESPLFPPSVRREKPAGSALIVGVLAEELAAEVLSQSPFLEVRPAREALAAEVAKAKPGDAVIALVHGTVEQAARILAGMKGKIDLAVVAHEGDEPAEHIRDVAGIAAVLPGQRGKHLCEVTLGAEPSLAITDLEEKWKGHEAITKLFDDYQGELRDQDLLGQVVPTPPRTEDTYAGTASCTACHPAAARKWEESKHSHAWKTLEDARHDADPECVGCHTVGFGVVSGFVATPRTPALVNVGCESCHGPSSRHAVDGTTPTSGQNVHGQERCAPCHVPEHSPGFDFTTYWPQIAHGSD